MRRLGGLLAAAIGVVLMVLVVAEPVAAERAVSPAPATREVLVEINAQRAFRGLRPLRISRQLAAAADFHTRDMARRGYFGHGSARGISFARRLKRFYPQARLAGENILWAGAGITAAKAVELWMRSPGHRQNILNRSWREIGISSRSFASAPGVFKGLDVTIITAVFAARAG